MVLGPCLRPLRRAAARLDLLGREGVPDGLPSLHLADLERRHLGLDRVKGDVCGKGGGG